MRNAGDVRYAGHRLILALLLLAMPAPAASQGQDVHGENSVFAGHGVAMAWGILKGATEEGTQVILRIVPTGAGFAAVRIEAVDPFTGSRHAVLDGRPLRDPLDVRTPRGTFADFPRREIQLYPTEADWQARKPSLTIFYLGLPDTTPEFTSEAALFAYLADALARVRRSGQGKEP
jgi:hypothetical protein